MKKKTTVGTELALKTSGPKEVHIAKESVMQLTKVESFRMPTTCIGCPCTVLLDAATFQTTSRFNYRQYAAEGIVTLIL